MVGELTNVINHVIKVLLIPYFVLFVISLFFLFLKRKKVFLILISITVFMTFWRTFFEITSSRYCVSFVILSGITIIKAISIVSHEKSQGRCFSLIFLICFIGLFTYNTIKSFSSFEKKYIYDLREDIAYIAGKQTSNIIIYENEFSRITPLIDKCSFSRIKSIDDVLNDSTCEKIIYDNTPLENEIYFVLPSKFDSLFHDINDGIALGRIGISPQTIRSYSTDYNKKKKYLIYRFNKLDIPPKEEFCEIVKNAVLKTYIPQYDTFVYQDNNSLLWVIGKDIEKWTEVIYQIQTDRLDLLPEDRKIHRFDNRGFFLHTQKPVATCGKYVVYRKEIPSEYPVTLISVGFNKQGNIIHRPFHINRFE